LAGCFSRRLFKYCSHHLVYFFFENRAGLMKGQNSEQGLRFSDTLIILLLTFSMFFTKEASFFSTEFAF